MADIDDIQRKIKSFTDTVNSFKSETVQIRVFEALLAELRLQATPPTQVTGRRRAKPSKTTKTKTRGGGPSGAQGDKQRSRKTPASRGASAMISGLLTDGFFTSPKTIGDIIKHCAANLGHHYKANECSTPLLRLLRDQKLERTKNEERQYQYAQAKKPA